MNASLRVVILVIAIVFALGNVHLVVRKKMSERAAILWMVGAMVGLLLAVFPSMFDRVAHRLGVDYPPAFLNLLCILVLLTIIGYQSVQITVLDKKVREIGQFVALQSVPVPRKDDGTPNSISHAQSESHPSNLSL